MSEPTDADRALARESLRGSRVHCSCESCERFLAAIIAQARAKGEEAMQGRAESAVHECRVRAGLSDPYGQAYNKALAAGEAAIRALPVG